VNEPQEYTRQQEQEDVLPQSYKLAKLILIIPATNVSTEQSCSAFKNKEFCVQHPGPRMTVMLVMAEYRKSSG
jgi:hypothetical protein